jgi:hypothetical protein
MPNPELLVRSRLLLLVIAIVVVGLTRAGDDMTAAHQELLVGCLDRGELRSVCECAGDEVLRRIDHSAERFAALERDIVRRQNAGQGPPALVLDAARACS